MPQAILARVSFLALLARLESRIGDLSQRTLCGTNPGSRVGFEPTTWRLTGHCRVIVPSFDTDIGMASLSRELVGSPCHSELGSDSGLELDSAEFWREISGLFFSPNGIGSRMAARTSGASLPCPCCFGPSLAWLEGGFSAVDSSSGLSCGACTEVGMLGAWLVAPGS